MDTRQPYPGDLTHAEWAQVCRVVPAPKTGGRPAKYPRREIVNALLYVARTGCQWRALPHDLPPWRSGQTHLIFDTPAQDLEQVFLVP
jgi:transposase